MTRRVFYDEEFLEDGETIELISLGAVRDDGCEFYAVNREFDWARIARRRWYAPWRWEVRHQWLLDNVVPELPKLHGDARLHMSTSAPGALGILDRCHPSFRSLTDIRNDFLEFVGDDDPDVHLWADYGAYDHVRLAQLWGPMIALPDPLPMWTHDLRQELERSGNPTPPAQPEGSHNALDDARQVKRVWEWLQTREASV